MRSTYLRSEGTVVAVSATLVTLFWVLDLGASWWFLLLALGHRTPVGAAALLGLVFGFSGDGLDSLEVAAIASSVLFSWRPGPATTHGVAAVAVASWATYLCVPDTEHALAASVVLSAAALIAWRSGIAVASGYLLVLVVTAGAVGAIGRPAAFVTVLAVCVGARFVGSRRSRLVGLALIGVLLARTVGLGTSVGAAALVVTIVAGSVVGLEWLRSRSHRPDVDEHLLEAT